MIEEATGRKAFVIVKPSHAMMRYAAQYMKLDPVNITVIGDTVETDIIGGMYMGFAKEKIRVDH